MAVCPRVLGFHPLAWYLGLYISRSMGSDYVAVLYQHAMSHVWVLSLSLSLSLTLSLKLYRFCAARA